MKRPAAKRPSSRPSRRELDLADFARRHHWPETIAAAGVDDALVTDALQALMVSMPGRRRVRAMELASLIEGRLIDEAAPAQADLYRTLAATLRNDYHRAFVVDRARPLTGRPNVLLTSAPRSGNTLLQRLFHEVFGYPVLAAPTIDDVATELVTAPVLMQIHAVRNRRALQFVDRLSARVVTVARHPLDVVISILHFSRHEPQILDWLDGEAIGSPTTLRGASPTSEQFVEWATGSGASRLLAITADWWNDPATYRIRYEDLIASTGPVVAKLADDLGIVVPEATDELLGEPVDPDGVRERTLVGTPNHHRWRSKADGWRDFLPRPVAERLAVTHRRVLADLGYAVDGPFVDAEEAAANWRAQKR